MTLKFGSEVTQGHSSWYRSIDWVWFLFVFYSNFVLKTHRFEIFDFEKCRDLEIRGQRSLKVIGTDTNRSVAYDFLLTFHNNHGLSRKVSKKNGDFSRNSQFLRPRWRGSPWNWVICARCQKIYSDGATGPKKTFDDIFSRVDRMHQRDGQTDGRILDDRKDPAYA